MDNDFSSVSAETFFQTPVGHAKFLVLITNLGTTHHLIWSFTKWVLWWCVWWIFCSRIRKLKVTRNSIPNLSNWDLFEIFLRFSAFPQVHFRFLGLPYKKNIIHHNPTFWSVEINFSIYDCLHHHEPADFEQLEPHFFSVWFWTFVFFVFEFIDPPDGWTLNMTSRTGFAELAPHFSPDFLTQSPYVAVWMSIFSIFGW